MSANYWFNRVDPWRPVCRVSYCPEPVATHPSGLVAEHGFCGWHVAVAPQAYLRLWERAKDSRELARVWQRLADDFEFEDSAREINGAE